MPAVFPAEYESAITSEPLKHLSIIHKPGLGLLSFLTVHTNGLWVVLLEETSGVSWSLYCTLDPAVLPGK